jgi:hypothetical protein
MGTPIFLATNLSVSYTEAKVMRKAIASAMVLLLLSVVPLCALIACPVTVSSCCHKQPAKTLPDCPYSILQKGKTNPTAIHAQWVGAIAQANRGAILPPPAGQTIEAPARLIDTAGLFLRNRVLLI